MQSVADKSADIQTSLFRIALGADGKKLLRNQPVPTKSDGTAMDTNKINTLILMMENAVIGEVNDTYERYVFRCRQQQAGECISDFITSLRELMRTCEFSENMQEKYLKDQIIYGIHDSTLRERILQVRKLSLAACIDIKASESASSQARDIAEGGTADPEVTPQKL